MSNLNIVNKKAGFNYALEQKYTAGMALTGTEVKSIRQSNASISEAYCVIEGNELFIKNMHISEWKFGSYLNHEPLRTRKLLLTKKELRKLKRGIETEGYAIIPIRVFLSDRGLIKIEIALAKGKKLFDKREDIKKKDLERETKRKF
ncbi:MAG: SsrA-binding protein [Bacteroidia bacterium]|jgi:SsrA-binding protein|nr:SsrA-binding protein [Bacteroidia bacterium]MCO5252845.1 SsrA-binding protein [Bacteroidota bacterium]MCZ2129721.1 SsrA-binding protein [Bacteroidia bacterium]